MSMMLVATLYPAGKSTICLRLNVSKKTAPFFRGGLNCRTNKAMVGLFRVRGLVGFASVHSVVLLRLLIAVVVMLPGSFFSPCLFDLQVE